MDSISNEVAQLVKEAKEEVSTIRKRSEEEKKAITEIGEISSRLKAIQALLKPKQNELNERIVKLNKIVDALSKIQTDMILTRAEEIFYIIEKNLLDGMTLQSEENNNSKKLIIYGDDRIGTIEVLNEKHSNVLLKVKVYNCSDEFPIQEPLKVFSIISFINNNFNYKLG